MGKRLFFAMVIKTNEGKYFSFAEKISKSTNLAHLGDCYYTAQICDTWKEAQELAEFWNECYRDNGTYAY